MENRGEGVSGPVGKTLCLIMKVCFHTGVEVDFSLYRSILVCDYLSGGILKDFRTV